MSFASRCTNGELLVGTNVSVGSGFTAEERLRYAANPSLIASVRSQISFAS